MSPVIRIATAVLLFSAACAPPGGVEQAASPPPERPNVVFVFYDQYRADNIGAYGGGDNMGRILVYLDEAGLAADTIVVFTSDHGEMLGSHGRRNKMVPYGEAVRIPMIVRWPGQIEAGSRTATLQTPLDHFPTLASLAGLQPPADLDGIDLAPELLGGLPADRDAVLMSNDTAHWDYFMTGSQPGATWPEWRGVKTKQFTYVRWLTGEIELYDDLADPFQMNDLGADPAYADVRDTLEARLQALLADAHDEFLPGNAYVDWVDRERTTVRTGLGPVE